MSAEGNEQSLSSALMSEPITTQVEMWQSQQYWPIKGWSAPLSSALPHFSCILLSNGSDSQPNDLQPPLGWSWIEKWRVDTSNSFGVPDSEGWYYSSNFDKLENMLLTGQATGQVNATCIVRKRRYLRTIACTNIDLYTQVRSRRMELITCQEHLKNTLHEKEVVYKGLVEYESERAQRVRSSLTYNTQHTLILLNALKTVYQKLKQLRQFVYDRLSLEKEHSQSVLSLVSKYHSASKVDPAAKTPSFSVEQLCEKLYESLHAVAAAQSEVVHGEFAQALNLLLADIDDCIAFVQHSIKECKSNFRKTSDICRASEVNVQTAVSRVEQAFYRSFAQSTADLQATTLECRALEGELPFHPTYFKNTYKSIYPANNNNSSSHYNNSNNNSSSGHSSASAAEVKSERAFMKASSSSNISTTSNQSSGGQGGVSGVLLSTRSASSISPSRASSSVSGVVVVSTPGEDLWLAVQRYRVAVHESLESLCVLATEFLDLSRQFEEVLAGKVQLLILHCSRELAAESFARAHCENLLFFHAMTQMLAEMKRSLRAAKCTPSAAESEVNFTEHLQLLHEGFVKNYFAHELTVAVQTIVAGQRRTSLSLHGQLPSFAATDEEVQQFLEKFQATTVSVTGAEEQLLAFTGLFSRAPPKNLRVVRSAHLRSLSIKDFKQYKAMQRPCLWKPSLLLATVDNTLHLFAQLRSNPAHSALLSACHPSGASVQSSVSSDSLEEDVNFSNIIRKLDLPDKSYSVSHCSLRVLNTSGSDIEYDGLVLELIPHVLAPPRKKHSQLLATAGTSDGMYLLFSSREEASDWLALLQRLPYQDIQQHPADLSNNHLSSGNETATSAVRVMQTIDYCMTSDLLSNCIPILTTDLSAASAVAGRSQQYYQEMVAQYPLDITAHVLRNSQLQLQLQDSPRALRQSNKYLKYMQPFLPTSTSTSAPASAAESSSRALHPSHARSRQPDSSNKSSRVARKKSISFIANYNLKSDNLKSVSADAYKLRSSSSGSLQMTDDVEEFSIDIPVISDGECEVIDSTSNTAEMTAVMTAMDVRHDEDDSDNDKDCDYDYDYDKDRDKDCDQEQVTTSHSEKSDRNSESAPQREDTSEELAVTASSTASPTTASATTKPRAATSWSMHTSNTNSSSNNGSGGGGRVVMMAGVLPIAEIKPKQILPPVPPPQNPKNSSYNSTSSEPSAAETNQRFIFTRKNSVAINQYEQALRKEREEKEQRIKEWKGKRLLDLGIIKEKVAGDGQLHPMAHRGEVEEQREAQREEGLTSQSYLSAGIEQQQREKEEIDVENHEDIERAVRQILQTTRPTTRPSYSGAGQLTANTDLMEMNAARSSFGLAKNPVEVEVEVSDDDLDSETVSVVTTEQTSSAGTASQKLGKSPGKKLVKRLSKLFDKQT